MNWNENLLIRDCIQYAIDEPMYDYNAEELQELNCLLIKFETRVQEVINIAGAMDILLRGKKKWTLKN
jgi:hypothetical protein